MIATEWTANVYAAVIAVCALVAVALVVWALRRGGKVTLPGGSLEIAQRLHAVATDLAEVKAKTESIDHAVNSKPPDEEPIKVHAAVAASASVDTQRRLQVVELSVATASEHAAEARRLARIAVADGAEVKAALSEVRSDIRRLLDTPTDPGATS